MNDDRGGRPQSIGELVSGVVNEKFGHGDLTQTVSKLWYTANGERERTHTVAVFVKEDADPNVAPQLIVYVDSNACVVDFNASREVYLARMEGAGLKLASITFRLSRYALEHKQKALKKEEPPISLPELSEDELAYVEELSARVPEKLRKSVSKAISSSMRRNKAENAEKS